MEPYFGSSEAAFDPHYMASTGRMVAMRLHALIFATQMGIPFASLSYQPKNAAYCQDLGLPEMSVDIHRLKCLDSVLHILRDDDSRLRSHLVDIRSDLCCQASSTMRDLFGSMVKVNPPS